MDELSASPAERGTQLSISQVNSVFQKLSTRFGHVDWPQGDQYQLPCVLLRFQGFLVKEADIL